MPSPMERMAAFHRAAGVMNMSALTEAGRNEAIKLRMRLISEEYLELDEELSFAEQGRGNYFDLAKEMADLLVVVYGTAEIMDIPLESVFNAVMDSNMSKLEGMERREDGKILKGPNYKPPNIPEAIGNAERW